MDKEGFITCYQNAYAIHNFLMLKHKIIESRFTFFMKNIDGNH